MKFKIIKAYQLVIINIEKISIKNGVNKLNKINNRSTIRLFKKKKEDM